MTDGFQHVDRISSKARERLGEDDVNFAGLRISQHSHEFGSGSFLGTGNTIVRIHAHINPFGVHLDQLAVIADLRRQ